MLNVATKCCAWEQGVLFHWSNQNTIFLLTINGTSNSNKVIFRESRVAAENLSDNFMGACDGAFRDNALS